MTKAELIKALEPYPDDIQIIVTAMNYNHDSMATAGTRLQVVEMCAFKGRPTTIRLLITDGPK